MATRGTMPKTEYVIEPGKQEITTSVVLDAPRELVFKAYTDPKLVARWWGPHGYTNEIKKLDARPGGEWHIVQRAPDGGEHPFRGVIHDVVANERICQTFEYLGAPGHVALQTATFESLGNKTKVVTHVVFESVMDRDGMVASGMRTGTDQSAERLSDLLAKVDLDYEEVG